MEKEKCEALTYIQHLRGEIKTLAKNLDRIENVIRTSSLTDLERMTITTDNLDVELELKYLHVD